MTRIESGDVPSLETNAGISSLRLETVLETVLCGTDARNTVVSTMLLGLTFEFLVLGRGEERPFARKGLLASTVWVDESRSLS